EGEVLVAAFLEGLLDLRQVLVRNYLQVELTIEGQHRHLHLAQGRPWIVGEEVTEPRAVEGLDRVSDQGVGAARRLELVRRQRRRVLPGRFPQLPLTGGGVVLRTDYVDHPPYRRRLLVDLLFGRAVGAGHALALEDENLWTGNARAREHDDESHVARLAGGERPHDATLAVADE